jgi:hypothetical protein
MVLLPGDPARVALGVNATEAECRAASRIRPRPPAGHPIPRLGGRAAALRPRQELHQQGRDRPADRRPPAGLAHPRRRLDARGAGHRGAVRHLHGGPPPTAPGWSSRRSPRSGWPSRPSSPASCSSPSSRSSSGGCRPAGGRHRHTIPACSSSNCCCRPCRWARPGRGAHPLRALGGARRAARGLPAHRPRQGAHPDAGAGAPRAAQCRRPGRHGPRAAAGDPAGRRGRHRAGLRHPRPRVAAARRGRQPRPHRRPGRRHGPRRRRARRQLRRRPALSRDRPPAADGAR